MAGFDGRSLDVVCYGAESAGLFDEAQAVQTQRRRASSRLLLLLQLERTLVVFLGGRCDEIDRSKTERFYVLRYIIKGSESCVLKTI